VSDTAAWHDVLFFEPITGNDFTTGSDSVFLYWAGGTGANALPAIGTITGAEPYVSLLSWNPGGVQTLAPADGNETFNVNDTPEPSTLLLALTAGLGIVMAKRRRA
jgi:hypothetical protein